MCHAFYVYLVYYFVQHLDNVYMEIQDYNISDPDVIKCYYFKVFMAFTLLELTNHTTV